MLAIPRWLEWGDPERLRHTEAQPPGTTPHRASISAHRLGCFQGCNREFGCRR